MMQLIKISLSCFRARFVNSITQEVHQTKESVKFISIQNSSDVHTCSQSAEELQTKIFEGFFSLCIKKETINRSWIK